MIAVDVAMSSGKAGFISNYLLKQCMVWRRLFYNRNIKKNILSAMLFILFFLSDIYYFTKCQDMFRY